MVVQGLPNVLSHFSRILRSSRFMSQPSGKMASAPPPGRATAWACLMVVATASAQLLNSNGEFAKRVLNRRADAVSLSTSSTVNTAQSRPIHPTTTPVDSTTLLVVPGPTWAGNGSSTLPFWAGMTGTAFPAPAPSAEAHSSQLALQPFAKESSAESHSTQPALVHAGGSNTVTTTTNPTPALEATQTSPTTTQTSTSPSGTSQSTLIPAPGEPWMHSSVAALSSHSPNANPSLHPSGAGIVVSATSTSTAVTALPATQSGTSAPNPASASSSQVYAQSASAQQTAATGDYAVTVGPSGDVGLQAVSTGSPQAKTSSPEVHTPVTGLAGTQSGLTGMKPAVTSARSNGDGGLRPLTTGLSNGTIGGNSTTGNSSNVLPYLGAASRRHNEGSRWWIWMLSGVVMVAVDVI